MAGDRIRSHEHPVDMDVIYASHALPSVSVQSRVIALQSGVANGRINESGELSTIRRH